jgi:EAL and modified HD-GYP domain-containing signal transduction protein
MVTQVVEPPIQTELPPEQESELRSLVRRPILDLTGKAHGYELPYWNGEQSMFREKSGLAGLTELGDASLFGLEQLTRGLPAFVNCTADSLAGDWALTLPPQLTVFQLPTEPKPDSELLDACIRLKARGFRLALTVLPDQVESKPLFGLADYAKLDFATTTAQRRKALLIQMKTLAVQPIAAGLTTQEEYRQACEEGFRLFEGCYYCYPEALKSRSIPNNRTVQLEILQELQRESPDLCRLSQLVKCDALLTYRLLRLLNSPLYAMRQEVTSIQTALLLLGDAPFRRIAMLAIATEFNGGRITELLRMAFERGRFCELAARPFGLTPAEQYIVGMMSLFPAMLRIPMNDLVDLVPLRSEVRDALLGKGSREGALLNWLERHDRADWAGCDLTVTAVSADPHKIMRYRAAAAAWADAVLNSYV